MGPTVTHSGRPREKDPASRPPSVPPWPLSSPPLTTAPTLVLSSTGSRHDPEHGIGHAVSTTQNPHLFPVPAGINVRREAAENWSYFRVPALHRRLRGREKPHRVRSGNVWRHAPLPGQIRPPLTRGSFGRGQANRLAIRFWSCALRATPGIFKCMLYEPPRPRYEASGRVVDRGHWTLHSEQAALSTPGARHKASKQKHCALLQWTR